MSHHQQPHNPQDNIQDLALGYIIGRSVGGQQPPDSGDGPSPRLLIFGLAVIVILITGWVFLDAFVVNAPRAN